MDYSASVLVKAVLDFTIEADSEEEAVRIAKAEMNKRPFFAKGVSISTRSVRFVGIYEKTAWDEVDE